LKNDKAGSLTRVPFKLKTLPTHIIFDKAQTLFLLSPGAIRTSDSYLTGLLNAFGKFNKYFAASVPTQNSVTQETFNENSIRNNIVDLLYDFINPDVDKKGFENKFIILAGHGEPDTGYFQITDRRG